MFPFVIFSFNFIVVIVAVVITIIVKVVRSNSNSSNKETIVNLSGNTLSNINDKNDSVNSTLRKNVVVSCQYCGSRFGRDLTKCPSCGAGLERDNK